MYISSEKIAAMIVKTISPEETYDIRKRVLRENIPLPFKFNGDLDEDTYHMGIFLENELIGVASFMKASLEGFDGNHYQLRGMATSSEHQGKGIGQILLSKSEELLHSKGCNFVWCNARKVALNFYKKNGYEITGEEFNIELIGPHYKMFKKL